MRCVACFMYQPSEKRTRARSSCPSLRNFHGWYGDCAGSTSTRARASWSCPQSSGAERKDVPAFVGTARYGVARPVVHERAALLKKTPPPIGGLDAVSDGMREGHLDHVVREVRGLCRPIPERRAKAVNRHVRAQLGQHVGHG